MVVKAVEYRRLDNSIAVTPVLGSYYKWMFVTRTVVGPRDQLEKEWSVYDISGIKVNDLGFRSKAKAKQFVDLLHSELAWPSLLRDDRFFPILTKGEKDLIKDIEQLAREG